jgi:Icc protein
VPAELSSVSDDDVVVHLYGDGRPEGEVEVVRLEGLEPGRDYQVAGLSVRTLNRPPGERLATFATVNDVHFGETECGVLEGLDASPVLSSAPGEPPYPRTMNLAAIAEISALGPDAVVVKGDLTDKGTKEEYEEFLGAYGAAFGERLHHVRGNHDAMLDDSLAATAPFCVELPGVLLAVLDTTVPGHHSGRLDPHQLEWLDELCSRASVPVLVFGHHHPWDPSSPTRPEGYFGIRPDDSEALVALAARRPRFAGYFCGHTHRNRVRRFAATGDRPWAEVACTKDYPGSWAEYRVYEAGVIQVHRRISAPDALSWSERCRALFGGLYPQYALGRVEDRCMTLWTGGG